ncbi:MAG: Mur ligase family protein [Gammaproteobacteria bacterium]
MTGPNVLGTKPAAIIDVAVDTLRLDPFIEAWKESAGAMLSAVGWDGAVLLERRLDNGVSLGFTAPIDALYAATEINDWAFAAAAARLADEPGDETAEAAERLRTLIGEESNPRLVALHDAALARGIPFLADDDYLSLGLGERSRTWSVAELPRPEQVPWGQLGAIPAGLVTGTNGKTTTVRLTAAIAGAAGFAVGYCSTDGIVAAGETLEKGDYSGPGGARAVLRDPRVQCAVLETARGGLLRRGTAMTHADAAVITNIGADHLDDFGVRDLEHLADIKWLVTSVLGARGTAVLNADDPRLVARAGGLEGPVTWFSLDPRSPVVAGHCQGGGTAWILDEGQLTRVRGDQRQAVVAAERIPVTLQGAARHNVANCLAAAALAEALGCPDDAISAGLCGARPDGNPGRANLFELGGARVLVDFAHNPDGIRALAGIVEHFGRGRRLLMLGQAGDRGDDSLRELATAAWSLAPDRVIIKEMAHYARGRQPGEVAGILRGALMAAGAEADCIHHQQEEIDGVREALAWLQPGDLAVLLTHEDIAGVRARLLEAGATAI